MPDTIMGKPKDEEKWEKAKKIVADQYGLGKTHPHFHRLVMGVYKKMIGAKSVTLILSLNKAGQ